ncbi:MAG: hypothetical protein AAFX87_17185 [Bacteroidota bacterium]
MIKKLLEKQSVFNFGLGLFSFFAKRKYFGTITRYLTGSSAKLNLFLNKPQVSQSVKDLAHTWKDLMPPDGQKFFKIGSVDDHTAYTEIHLHCPLRGTGNVEACYKLMHYDRTLMDQVGGQLIVLESQSNSGQPYCKLAIRKKEADASDLEHAHLKQ